MISPAINPVYLTGANADWPLAELAACGYRALEITPGALAVPRRWQLAADKAGLPVTCVNAVPELTPFLAGSLSDALPRNRQETIRRLLRTLATMRKAGIPSLVIAPSWRAEVGQTTEQAHALLVDAVRKLARAGDTTILLESAPRRLFATAAQLAALIDEIAMPNVAAALDVGHAMLSGETPAKAAKALGARLRYVHVHDTDVSPGAPPLDRHLPLGMGSAKKAEVRKAIGALPFAVTITPNDGPVAAARVVLEWLG